MGSNCPYRSGSTAYERLDSKGKSNYCTRSQPRLQAVAARVHTSPAIWRRSDVWRDLAQKHIGSSQFQEIFAILDQGRLCLIQLSLLFLQTFVFLLIGFGGAWR